MVYIKTDATPNPVLFAETSDNGHVYPKFKSSESFNLCAIVVLRPVNTGTPVGTQKATQIGRIDGLGCKLKVGKVDALASEFVSKPGRGKTDQANRQDFPHIIVFNLDKNRQKASTFDFFKRDLHN